MDKETLSHYGWVVVLILVLSVLIALATPFGQYIRFAVENTTQGLFDVQQQAGAIAGLNIPSPNKKPGGGNENKPNKDKVFYGNYNYDTEVMTWYDEIPATVSQNDVYLCGDYIYMYDDECSGWEVRVAAEDTSLYHPEFQYTDREQTSYGPILDKVNGKPVTAMIYTFNDCTKLKSSPTIPNSIIYMNSAFSECTSLTVAPIIPNSVKSLDSTFYRCTSLKNAPAIPNGVTNMMGTFKFCSSLEIAPSLPNSVTEIAGIFQECTKLTTAPIIPSNVTNMQYAFSGCTSLKTYAGNTDGDGNFSKYVIPNGVTTLRETFSNCTKLTAAPAIPYNVMEIYGTFKDCISLTTAPDMSNASSLKIVTDAFVGCTSLTGTVNFGIAPIVHVYNCFGNVNFATQNITLTGNTTKLDSIGKTGMNYCSTCNGTCKNNH